MTTENMDLALAIVRLNLLKPEPWNFDELGQATVQTALLMIVEDYERLRAAWLQTQDDGK